MGALLLIGLAHILLLWDGDILVIYAITGVLLIGFRKTLYNRLRIWVISLLGIPAGLVAIIFSYTLLARLSASGSATFSESDRSLVKSFADTTATQKLLYNDYLSGITERIHTYLNLSPLLLSRIPTVLAMFLIGLYLGRSDFIRNIPEKVELLKKIRFWGLTVGFSLMLVIVIGTKVLPPVTGLVAIIEDQYLAGPVLCLGYASAFTLAFLNQPNFFIFKSFARVGQMALTNYLAQSLVLTFLSYGWGLGLALRLNGFHVVAICLALYPLQVLMSSLWLSKFKYGPLEWIWRCITYWKILPIRIS